MILMSDGFACAVLANGIPARLSVSTQLIPETQLGSKYFECFCIVNNIIFSLICRVSPFYVGVFIYDLAG